MPRRRSNYSNTYKGKSKIIWSEEHMAYYVITPYNADYVKEIKFLCTKVALYDSDNKAWIVFEEDIDRIKQLVYQYFKEFDFHPKPAQQQSQGFNYNPAASNGTKFKEFLELSGRDAITKAYRFAMQQHHPDIGGDPNTAQRINELWAEIKKELKW